MNVDIPLEEAQEFTDDFLEHFGMKGMHWGVRKRSGGTATSGGKTVYKKKASQLSTADLNKRIKRMEVEQRYESLNRSKADNGKAFAGEILKGTGKTVASTVLAGAALFAIKTALGKKLGSAKAAAIIR